MACSKVISDFEVLYPYTGYRLVCATRTAQVSSTLIRQ